jgi:hypothetical protein
MVEDAKIIERYRSFNPLERNLELRQIFTTAPDLADPVATRKRRQELLSKIAGMDLFTMLQMNRPMLNDIGRRTNSDTETIMSQRLNILLGFAYLTPSGRIHLAKTWKDVFLFGIGRRFY